MRPGVFRQAAAARARGSTAVQPQPTAACQVSTGWLHCSLVLAVGGCCCDDACIREQPNRVTLQASLLGLKNACRYERYRQGEHSQKRRGRDKAPDTTHVLQARQR